METVFKVGDRVYHHKYGWSTIAHIDKIIKVNFDNNYSITFDNNDLVFLSFTKYTLEGFSQERPWEPEIPEIGEWAFFWDDGQNVGAIWRKLQNKYGNGYTFKDALGVYSNCSKTPPPHLGGK